MCVSFFFYNDTAPTAIYTLSLHDALPIFPNPVEIADAEIADFAPRCKKVEQHPASAQIFQRNRWAGKGRKPK